MTGENRDNLFEPIADKSGWHQGTDNADEHATNAEPRDTHLHVHLHSPTHPRTHTHLHLHTHLRPAHTPTHTHTYTHMHTRVINKYIMPLFWNSV